MFFFLDTSGASLKKFTSLQSSKKDFCWKPSNSGLIMLDLKMRQLQGRIRGLNRHPVWGSCHCTMRLVSVPFMMSQRCFSVQAEQVQEQWTFLIFGKTRVLTDTWETHESRKILQIYAPFKSIRRNLFTEAIRPERDLEPFITPLMTSRCQHAQLIRRQGHLNLLVLSIIFQCVTCNLRHFAPFSPQGHFVLSKGVFDLKMVLCSHNVSFFLLTLQGRLLLQHL